MKIRIARKSNSHEEYNKYIVTTKKGKEIPIYAKSEKNALYKARFTTMIQKVNPTSAAFGFIIYLTAASVTCSHNPIALALSIVIPLVIIKLISDRL
tara:strand:+ start:794 stop:1084 length:291 start_codon:yes stop_codon:yes gene_type:complete